MAASVIIPAHNAEHCLPVQLAALARQDFAAAFEVVVVCNRCSDGTAPAAERFLGRLNIKVISADEKASAAYARNVGAQHAKGSLLLFCDADDQVSEAWVRSMVDALERGPADFVAGRLDVDRQGLPNWIYDWSYAWVDGKCLLGQGGGDLPFVSSAALGVTRSAFDSVGGFDERFSEAGGEDRDLSWRLFLAGARVGEAWSAGVRYTPRKTLGGLLHQQKAYARGRLAVDRKWGRIKRPVSRRVLTRRLASTAVRTMIQYGFRAWEAVWARLVLMGYEHKIRTADFKNGAVEGVLHSAHFVPAPGVPLIGGLAFDAASQREAQWYARKGVEARALKVLSQNLKRGDTFVDVGANIGTFAVAGGLLVGGAGKVICYEPGKSARAPLSRNLVRHGMADTVEVRSSAVGAQAGWLPFMEYQNTLVSGLANAPIGYSPRGLREQSTCRVVALSDEIAGVVNLIKVDVEGMGGDVLEGASDLIRRSPDVVLLIEYNPDSLDSAGKSFQQVIDVLPRSEWIYRIIDEAADTPIDQLPEFDPSRWHEQRASDQVKYFNLLISRRRPAE